MQLQFDKIPCAFVSQLVSQAQTQEQTQEVRLSDNMPDIGRILGCWGQIMIRSKEWRQGQIAASGGVKAWVLYVGEDGVDVRCMDAWIPFQMHWPIPDIAGDGQIHLQPFIQAVECRGISARKMMIRVNICIHARAYEPSSEQIMQPPVIPENVYIRKRSYPLELPVEAGEKHFAIDDEFIFPEGTPNVSQIVRFEVFPEIREQKVLSGKVIFRGGYTLCMLYICPEGKLHTYKTEGAFSQFSDLDKDHSASATANMSLLLTLAELDADEQGRLHLKCGLACQYLIFDRMTVEVCDDAYSPDRQVKLQLGELRLPVRLEAEKTRLAYNANVAADAYKIVDHSVCWNMPMVSADEERMHIALEGMSHLLYLDEQDQLQGVTASVKEEWSQLSDPMNRVDVTLTAMPTQAAMQPEGIGISSNLSLDICVGGNRGIPMVTQMELGETIPVDPERPSVILRRVGSDSVWDIAKAYGSTVERINEANALESEPLPERMLLIPLG